MEEKIKAVIETMETDLKNLKDNVDFFADSLKDSIEKFKENPEQVTAREILEIATYFDESCQRVEYYQNALNKIKEIIS